MAVAAVVATYAVTVTAATSSWLIRRLAVPGGAASGICPV